jgi:quercetin dioxygenase-like cupin family protein
MMSSSPRVRALAAALSIGVIAGAAPALSASPPSGPAGTFNIVAVTEKKVTAIPDGPLYWQIETFPTLARAQAAAAPTALAAEVEGKVWLFTLGNKSAPAHAGGTPVAEVGPVTRITASEYLLRINNAVAGPGTKTSVHYHPGTEAFYLLSGSLSQKTPQGVINLEAGQSTPGRGPETVMEVTSTGKTDLHALVMFLVDASKPFSTPAKFD